MKTTSARVAFAALLLAFASLAGCTKTEDKPAEPTKTEAPASDASEKPAASEDKPEPAGDGEKVAFIPKLTGVGFFEAGGEGAVAAGPKFGVKAEYLGAPEASVAKQVELINNYVGQGYKAIAVSSTSPDGLCNATKKAMKQGVVVLTWDSDTNPDCRQFYISQGTPNDLGSLLVEMASADLPKDTAADVAFHYSSPTVTDQNQWTEVAKAEIAKDTKWKIVDTIFSENKTDLAVQKAEALLNANPNLKAIICPDANALPGTAKAVENLGRKDVVVVGFSTPNAMKDYVKNGTVKRFGLWDVKQQGALSIAVASELLKGKELKVGDTLEVEGFPEMKIQPNHIQGYDKSTDADNSGIIVLPERVVFTKDNIDNYDF